MAVPGAPTISAITVLGSNALHVNWGSVATADGYYVYRSEDDITYTKLWDVAEPTTEYADASCLPSTQYYYKVSAYNNDGEGAQSASDNDTTSAEDWKTVYSHQIGPFKYDVNRYDPNTLLGRYALYTDGVVRCNDLLIASGGTLVATGASVYFADVEVLYDKAFYLGATDVDGSWRIVRSGNNLVFERRESGSWVTKDTITP